MFVHLDFVCYNQNMKTQHGGKRHGSGRKPLFAEERLVRVRVSLTAAQWQWLRRRGNASAEIRRLIDERRKGSEANFE